MSNNLTQKELEDFVDAQIGFIQILYRLLPQEEMTKVMRFHSDYINKLEGLPTFKIVQESATRMLSDKIAVKHEQIDITNHINSNFGTR